MNSSKNLPAGFSLIETIIAMSLLMVLLSAGFILFSASLRSFSKINQKIEQNQNSQIVMKRITEEVRGSRGILSISTPSRLVLDYLPDTIAYELNDLKFRRSKNGYGSYLTTENQITDLTFSYPGPHLVEIKIKTQGRNYRSRVLVRNYE